MSASDPHKEKGNAEFRNKNFEAAAQHFTAGIEVDPTNHVLYSNRSACYASLTRWEDALKDAEKCVEVQPAGWSKGYARLGAALHGLQRFDDALKAYEKGLELDPSNEAVKERIEEVKAAQRAGGANPFGNLFGPDTFAKIQTNPRLAPFLQQPDYVQTINLLIQNPSMAQGFMKDQRIAQTMIELLGLSSQMPQQPQQSPPSQPPPPKREEPKPAPKPAAPPAPKDPSVLAKERGNEHYKKREFAEALACYEEAISLDPKNGTFYLNKTSVYFEMGDMEKCMEVVKDALDKYETKEINAPDFVLLAKLLTRKGQIFQHGKKYTEAIECYQAALRENRNADSLNKLNACEAEKKKHDVEAYYDPQLGAQAKENGNTLFKSNKYPEAVKEYTESIKRHPFDHTVYSNRAAAYMKLGAYDDAIKDCEKSLSIEPTFVKAVVRLAHCYFFTKEYSKATQEYDRGLKMDPNNEECRDGLMRTRAKITEAMHSGEVDEERIARAKADPEIQQILGDSYMQLVLREMQMDPKRADEYMADPDISAKIQKLAMAGILSFGPAKQKH